MQVFLDDQPVPCDDASIAGALDAAKRQAEATHRVIIEATLDGDPVPTELLEAPPEAPFDASEIRFVSAEPKALVHTTLLDVADLMPQVATAQDQAAERLQAGELGEGVARLGEAMEVWDHVQQATLHGCQLLGVDMDAFGAAQDQQQAGGDAPEPLSEAVQRLAASLREVKRAIRDEDWASLADVVGCDLCDEAERWERILRALARDLGPSAADDGANHA